MGGAIFAKFLVFVVILGPS